MSRPLATSLLTAAIVAIGTTFAFAQSKPSVTGTDSIHAQFRAGSKICMSSHEHYGEGSLPSRKGAEGAAMRAWQDFTAWEYGTAWGRYAMAAGKAMSCTQSGGNWICRTSARPCRSAR